MSFSCWFDLVIAPYDNLDALNDASGNDQYMSGILRLQVGAKN